jgi:hypothetical protein
MAKRYGKAFVLFPVGQFNYTWSRNISDAFVELNAFNSRIKYMKMSKDDEAELHEKMHKFMQDQHEYLSRVDQDGYLDEVLKKAKDRLTLEILAKKKHSFDIKDYDIKKLGYQADEDLDKALKFPGEIMIKCDSAIYVDNDYYNKIIRYMLDR